MLDIKFVCNNPEVVKQNIKNKFQEEKLPLVDQVIDLYQQSLKAKQESEALRANRNKLSKQIGMLMGQAKKDPSKKAEADAVKAQVGWLAAASTTCWGTWPGSTRPCWPTPGTL